VKLKTEFLVRKRDGRIQPLRASKLARSIHAALAGSSALDLAASMDVAESALAAVAGRRDRPVSTGELADSVVCALGDAGMPGAAERYQREALTRRRRRDKWRSQTRSFMLECTD